MFDDLFPDAEGIFSVKPLAGHCQAAAGSVELIASLYGFERGVIPAPHRVAKGHPRLLDGPTACVEGPIVKSSLGMGGHNGVMVLEAHRPRAEPGTARTGGGRGRCPALVGSALVSRHRVRASPSSPTGRSAAEAVVVGGGEVVAVDDAEGLVWVDWSGPGRLGSVLEQHPGIRWVHLPGAGIESFLDAGLVADGRVWTCSKGAHSSLIAEHALALALAGLHSLAPSARASSWEATRVTALAGQPVTIVGGGGIASALVRLPGPVRGAASPWCAAAPSPSPGRRAPSPSSALHDALPDARLVVILALALTPETRHIIAAPELDAMHDRAWLVNVSRGGPRRHRRARRRPRARRHRRCRARRHRPRAAPRRPSPVERGQLHHHAAQRRELGCGHGAARRRGCATTWPGSRRVPTSSAWSTSSPATDRRPPRLPGRPGLRWAAPDRRARYRAWAARCDPDQACQAPGR